MRTLRNPLSDAFGSIAEVDDRPDWGGQPMTLLLRLFPLSCLLRGLRFLRFRFLRHCCPPSHDEMAMSEQCLRESQALHSDYYRATKKTRLPLKEVCMKPEQTAWTAAA